MTGRMQKASVYTRRGVAYCGAHVCGAPLDAVVSTSVQPQGACLALLKVRPNGAKVEAINGGGCPDSSMDSVLLESCPEMPTVIVTPSRLQPTRSTATYGGVMVAKRVSGHARNQSWQ